MAKAITHQKVRAVLKKGHFHVGGWGRAGKAGCASHYGDIEVRHKWGCIKDEIEVRYFTDYGRRQHKTILRYLKIKLKKYKVVDSGNSIIIKNK